MFFTSTLASSLILFWRPPHPDKCRGRAGLSISSPSSPLLPDHSKPRSKYLLMSHQQVTSHSHRTSGFPFLSLADHPDRNPTTPCWGPHQHALSLAMFFTNKDRFYSHRRPVTARFHLPRILHSQHHTKPYVVKLKINPPGSSAFLRSVSSPEDSFRRKQTSFSSLPSKKALAQTAIQFQ
jgi:hypothetical protein